MKVIGLSGLIGLIIGIALIAFAEPKTTGGVILLVVVPMIAVGVVASLASRLIRRTDGSVHIKKEY